VPTISVTDAWNQRPKGILKTNEQGSRVKRIDKGEDGRYMLYTESAPKGVRVAGTFPLWYEGNFEPKQPMAAQPKDVRAAPKPKQAAPTRSGKRKAGLKARQPWFLTDKAIEALDGPAGLPSRKAVVAVPLWLIADKDK